MSMHDEEQLMRDLETEMGIKLDDEQQLDFDSEMQRAVDLDRAAGTVLPPSHEDAPEQDNDNGVAGE